MDVLGLILNAGAGATFAFAASGRELRHYNEIALGLGFLIAALVARFTATIITTTTIGQ